MKKYFATVTDYGTQSRNKLDQAAKDFVKTKDYRLIHGDLAKAQFIKDIEFGIHSLNAAYPRCKQLKCSTWGNYKKRPNFIRCNKRFYHHHF